MYIRGRQTAFSNGGFGKAHAEACMVNYRYLSALSHETLLWKQKLANQSPTAFEAHYASLRTGLLPCTC